MGIFADLPQGLNTMAKIRAERLTDCHDGPLVVFNIGMRINHFWRLGQWLPVVRSMGPLIAELSLQPDSGFLAHETLWQPMRTIMLVQYWRSFESLEAYARDPKQQHLPVWAAFNRAIGTDGTVGIFHETYVVEKGAHETIYVNMPRFGLGAIGEARPVTGDRQAARARMRG